MAEKTVLELETELAQARQNFGSTVDELAARLHPKAQFDQVKDQASQKVGEVGEVLRTYGAKAVEKVTSTVDRAAEGDLKSKGIVYGVIAGAGLLFFASVVGLFRRSK